MNFTELYKKISNLDKGTDTSINECSCDEMGPEPQPKQADNVNMNISINGQGAGGIRDLMDILRNIDKSDEPQHHDKPLHGSNAIIDEPMKIELNPDESIVPSIDPPQIEMPQEEEVIDDSYSNSVPGGSDPTQYAIASVIGMGDDLASKGSEKLKVNGGGNPGAVSESLVNHLKSLYNEVKNKKINEGYDLPGYGDEETWPKSYKPKHKSHGSYDDERIPGTGSQQDIEGDIVDKRNQEREQHRKQVKNTYVDKEGTAPNGEKYNKIYVIKATNKNSAEHEVHLFNKHEWGAKKIVDQKIKHDDDGSVSIALYIADNHKYGMWRPWKDEPPTSKPLSFN